MSMKPLRGTRIVLSNPLARGLFNAWLFREGGGAFTRELLENRTATFTGTWEWVGGESGYALRATTGNNDYLHFATTEPRCNAEAGFAFLQKVRFWQLPSAAGSNAYLLAYQGTSAYIWTTYGFSTNDTLVASMRDAAGTNRTSGNLYSIVVGQWHTLCCSYGGGVLNCYVDGVLAGTIASGTVLADVGLSLRFGLTGANSPEASIECAMFWNRQLRADEARRISADPYCIFGDVTNRIVPILASA